MRSGFRPRDPDPTTESMEGVRMGLGSVVKGVLGQNRKAFGS